MIVPRARGEDTYTSFVNSRDMTVLTSDGADHLSVYVYKPGFLFTHADYLEINAVPIPTHQ